MITIPSYSAFLLFMAKQLLITGDAILALWTVERVQLSEVISLVVKCSLNIQDQCGVRETEVGCQLKVKIGACLSLIQARDMFVL